MSFLKKNYHWVIAAIALIQLFFHSGAGNNFSGLHVIPVSEYLGITRAEFSLAYSTKNLVAMFFTMISGAILTRFGYRKAAGFGMLLSAGVYFLLAKLESYPLFFLYCALLGITNSLCATSAVTKIISSWFHKHKGTVLGAVSAATGLGGSIMCIAQTAAIERYSWRASFALCGFGILFAGILVFLFIRNEPREMGLVPYGEGEAVVGKKKRISQDAKEGLSMKSLFRRPSFYLMILFTFLSCFCIYMVYLVLIPHFQDIGFSKETAGYLNSLLLFVAAGFKLIIGFVSDRIGPKKVTLLCLAFSCIGLVLLAFAKTFIVALLAILIFGLGLPLTTITVPLLAFSLFGYRSQAQYTGVFMGMISAASTVGNIFTNFLFDAFGTYKWGFLGSAVGCFILIFLYLILYRMADKDPASESLPA